ncbi:MAG: aminotransferase class IV [Gemmataceae bacterium]
MESPIAYRDGQFLPQDELMLSIHDAGFVWGATITDRCRTVHHKLYRWADHLDRFRRSCRATEIYPALSQDEIDQAARELVKQNVADLPTHLDLTLVMITTPGEVRYPTEREVASTFFMYTQPLPLTTYKPLFEQGARLVIPTTRHVPNESIDPRIKQRSRLHWWLAEQEARRADTDASALLLDKDGYVTETVWANVLLVKEDVVYSPPRHTILEGVSLQVVTELCERVGIPFQEKPMTGYDAINADEAMLTCTSYCLAGVSRINHIPLTWPGPVFAKLLEAWSFDLGLDIRGQFVSSG